MLCFPQDLKIINAVHMTTTNAAVTGDYISVKTFKKVWVVFKFLQAATHATVCSILEATNVSAGSAAAITAVMPIWKNADVSTTDTLTRGTDAATVTLTAGTTNQIAVMELDPVILSAGFDCIAAYTSASSEATNFVDITYYGLERYPSQTSTQPSAIID